jgi:hypothetical protein
MAKKTATHSAQARASKDARTASIACDAQTAVAKTRAMDSEDVRSGRMVAEQLHLVPKDMVKRARVVFPTRYR